MNDDLLKKLTEQWLPQVEAGQLGSHELAERILQHQTQSGLAFQADIDRRRRCGLGEVIYGPGKSPEMILAIAQRLFAAGEEEVLVTRVDVATAKEVCSSSAYSRYDLLGRTLRLRNNVGRNKRSAVTASSGQSSDQTTNVDRNKRSAVTASSGIPSDQTTNVSANPPSPDGGYAVGVVCAGSTDLPVAREALETLQWMGARAYLIVDVGVAGPYRLLPHLDRLRQSVALVVIAGMEGALASVVGGLVACPVIAVPTSVGYGANLQGVTTLLSMLSSCAAGVTVVNIDAGFKGGYVAGLIALQSNRRQ